MITVSEPSETIGEKRRKKILLAILRIEKGRPRIVEKGRKLSISSAAEEAEISAAYIHNKFPDIAELIRQKIGIDIRKQKNAISAKVHDLKSEMRNLTVELKELKKEFASLASINASLMQENDRLISIIQSDNVKMFPPKLPS